MMINIAGGALLALICCAQDQSLPTPAFHGNQSVKVMVFGFVGGLRSPESLNQGVVLIQNRLKLLDCGDLRVKSYSHFRWRRAFDDIFQTVDSDHNHRLSQDELQRAPKLVLFGHSLGGWAVIKLARRLEKAKVPIELTVQLDTVGIGDAVVPGNVKFAMNYYQRTQWPLRGEKLISAQKATGTQIMDNVLIPSVHHEALARQMQISDFITDQVRAFCAKNLPPEASPIPARSISGKE